ncbi:MAG: M48 family metalloprotease [Planctomycetes bacterium]|nr:M48 family metalloprotease [Planctomycetota bacterium]
MRISLQKLLLRCLAILLLPFVFTTCEAIKEGVRSSQVILEQNPEILGGEDRTKILKGLDAAHAMITEIDTAEEIAMGQSLAVKAFASFGKPCKDRDLNEYVTRVGTLVALQSDRPSLPYSFAVVENEDPTALALPGGFVFVSTQLLRMLHSESELAAILGHEIAHIAEKHGLEITLRDRRIRSFVDFAAELDEDISQYRQFVDESYNKLAHQGYDQRYEIKADLAGTRYAYRAGYHPGGLLPFLQKSAESNGEIAFEVFKTHPDPNARIDKIRTCLESLGHYQQRPELEERYNREVLQRIP